MEQSGGGQSMLSGSSDSGKSNPEDVVIYTMQDDLALVRKNKTLSSKIDSGSNTNKPAAPVVDKVTSRQTESTAPIPDSKSTTPQPLPLKPVKQSTESNKVVMAPPTKHRKKSHVFAKLLVIIFILTIIGGGGALGWKFILSDYINQDSSPQGPVNVVELENMIPQDVVIMVNYKIENEQDATNISNAWQNTVNNTPSKTNLLEGDPRYLIENYSVEQIHYLLLEGDSKPYLLIKSTPQTDSFVESMEIGKVLSRNGWYILHAFDTALYAQELAKGVWADKSNGSTEFSLLNNKIGVVLGQGIVRNVRQSWSSKGFSTGQMKSLFTSGSFLSQGQGLSLTGTADLTGGANEVSSMTDQRLLEVIPSDALVARMGANFIDDLSAWNNEVNLLDEDILDKPIVNSLLTELTIPYAYYLRERQDGMNDIGLIMSLPNSLREQLAIGDESLEAALPILIPLILDRNAGADFTFADNIYNDIALRYVNIAGPNQALDYAFVDNYLLVATSKEGMFTLIDTVIGNSPSLNTANYWQDLFGMWGTIPQANNIVIGRVNNPVLTSMLPLAADNKDLIFGFSMNQLNNLSVAVNGILVLNNQQSNEPDTANSLFEAASESEAEVVFDGSDEEQGIEIE